MTYGLLIANGTTVDGSGSPRFKADVTAQDGRVVGAVDDIVIFDDEKVNSPPPPRR